MYYPHSVKRSVRDGKTGKLSETTQTGVRNCDQRKSLIDRFGEQRFKELQQKDSRYKKYQEPEVPAGCKWLFGQFMYIWQNCEVDSFSGQRIFTFRTLNEYTDCMGTKLSILEKKLLLQMKHWADEQIAEFEMTDKKDK